MYKITWDTETGGVLLHSRIVEGTLGTSPRPVFWEELDLLKLNELGWEYPHCEEPLLWAVNKQYYYRGTLVFEAKGANIYDPATVVFAPGQERLKLKPVNVKKMLEKTHEFMFLLESEAIEFIHETYTQYAGVRKTAAAAAANQMDFEALAKRMEAKRKQKMAIVKEDCDSFDVMPLEEAEQQGKKVYQTTKIDRFLASFSGGKDSQVVLDLCTRAIPSTEFEVIYSDTGYELPPSLSLYEEVQRHYGELYPDLKFSVTKNHESVTNYWDKIGTPSDTHRWCCSIMKTAPLYRSLKVEGNKQAKVITFDGVRAEESQRRTAYSRFGKGKHLTIYNAHPILHWNAVEIFLYLFQYNLPINVAYRYGKARVGCIICPFSTGWDDMIAQRKYPDELRPFTDRLIDWAKRSKIQDTSSFLKNRNWKIKAIGDREKITTEVAIDESSNTFKAKVTDALNNVYSWFPAVGEYSVSPGSKRDTGSIKFSGKIYEFAIEHDAEYKNFKLEVPDATDPQFVYFLRRLIYKTAHCVKCEVCEVDCPTGALRITKDIKIDKNKCIHCHKCMTSHDRGCIAADCVRMIKDMDKKLSAKVQGYKTFGMRDAWLDEFFADPEYFWNSSSLNKPQEDGFRSWLKDAEIIDAKKNLTEMGELLQTIYQDDTQLAWEIILVNLAYNSFIVNWFANNVKVGSSYSKVSVKDAIMEGGFDVNSSTLDNAIGALFQTFNNSPVGDTFNFGTPQRSNTVEREDYEDVSPLAVAYCLYRYAEDKKVRSLRVSDFYNEESENGPFKILGVRKNVFERVLKSLNSMDNRVVIAELSMGLDSITLRDDIDSLTVAKQLSDNL